MQKRSYEMWQFHFCYFMLPGLDKKNNRKILEAMGTIDWKSDEALSFREGWIRCYWEARESLIFSMNDSLDGLLKKVELI